MNDVTRYADMKDSGVEWIGKIPSHISMSRLGLHCNIILGKMLCTSQINESYSLESYYCAANVHFGKVDDTDLKQMWFSSDEKKKYAVKTGDLLVVEGGAGAGGCAIVHENTKKAFVQNSIMIVRSYYGDNRYISYLIESLVGRGYVDFVCNKATIPHFTKDKIENVPYPVFSVEEYCAISNFLDDMCNNINSIIDSARTSIEEYKKWKASVIYEAVTKGLDPHAEMKDSGVKWIGKIPKHWKAIKAKFLVSIENGSDPVSEGDIPVYGSGSSSFKTCGESKKFPSVLLGRKGATLHIPHYINEPFWNVDTAFNVYVKNNNILLIFYYYCSICFDYKYYISATTLPSMTQTNYKGMVIPVPTINEQHEIVSYLDTKCSEIDHLISEKEALVTDLESYKKSLIYEVVTGKRKVS